VCASDLNWASDRLGWIIEEITERPFGFRRLTHADPMVEAAQRQRAVRRAVRWYTQQMKENASSC
jgi:hypothetical protein